MLAEAMSPPEKGKQAIEEDVARDVISALRSVVQSGTGSVVASNSYQVAGKTGTNGIERDGKNIINSAWFVGFTPQIATSVMFVAGDDGNGSLDAYARPGDSAFFGGTYPARMWRDYMQVAMEDRDWESFPEPGNVNLGNERVGQVYVPPAPRTEAPTTTRTQESTRTSEPSQTQTGEASAPETTQASEAPSAPGTTQPATQPASQQPTQQQPTQPAPTRTSHPRLAAGTSPWM